MRNPIAYKLELCLPCIKPMIVYDSFNEWMKYFTQPISQGKLYLSLSYRPNSSPSKYQDLPNQSVYNEILVIILKSA